MPGTIHLRPGHVQPVWTGHPWVFAQAIARIDGSPQSGDEVTVLDPRGNFLGRGFFSPQSAIPVRLLTRDRDVVLDGSFLEARIAAAAAWRRRLLGLPGVETNGFRLVHAEGDGLPGLVVDAYDDVLAMQLLTAGMKRRQNEIIDALVKVTGARSIIEVASSRHQKIEGFEVTEGVVFGPSVSRLAFLERSFAWEVHPPGHPGGGGQKTGYYFDQRETRAMVESSAAGLRVLDVYSYTGGFALAAARGGAREVIGVDSSALALESAAAAAARANLAERVRWVRGDARKVMTQFHADGEKFALVVIDPPKLALGARDVEEARGHYRKLNALAVKLVAPGGLLVTCSCSQAIGGSEFLRAVATGARESGREVMVLRLLGQPPDHPVPAAFPEGRYLKVVLARVP